jgi:hypothetical protein
MSELFRALQSACLLREKRARLFSAHPLAAALICQASPDADFLHRPDFFEAMIRAGETADVVVASRYIAGGSADCMAPRSMDGSQVRCCNTSGTRLGAWPRESG